MYIDTHTHIHYADFDEDRDDIAQKLQEIPVYVVVIGTDLDTSERALLYTQKYPYAKATVGYHPNDHGEWSIAKWEEIAKLATHENVVAIGETGIDLYRDQSEENKNAQIDLFHRHIDLAQKLDKPIIIHSRDAFPEVEKILQEYPKIKVIFHCFTGSREWMERLSTLTEEIYFSYSGIVTFKNNVDDIKEAAKHTPGNRILTETDSPYLAPVPHRGKRNDSTLLPFVTDYLAELREVNREQFKGQVYRNAQQVFKNL